MESNERTGGTLPASSALATVDNPTSTREHLISTAVKFLQNPRVRPTTLAQKQGFLKRKGLTDEEIEAACQNAGAYDDEQNNNVPGKSSKALVESRGLYPPPTRTSLLLKAMDVANMIALISIGSYSLYSLWKHYISPRIFGTRSRLEQNYERLLESITKLNENVIELRELIRETHLQSLQSSRSQSSYELQELKKEIASIKSLLLGRNQFPSPSPGIPSWQMVEAGDNSNENSDESSSRRRSKKDKSERTTSRKEPDDSQSEKGDEEVLPGAVGSMRKHPSLDSNNGFHSGSSCEVVFLNKNDSSDPDHSE